MKHFFKRDFSRPRHVKIAGVLAAGALALLALDAGLELQPAPVTAPVVARVAVPGDTSGVHSLAYYPEQLAVLNSLSTFTPAADPGVAGPESPATAVKPPAAALAAGEVKPVRHVVAAAKPSAPLVHVAAAGPAASDTSVKVFGVAVPGASSLRDNAARVGEAAWGLGGKIASVWR